MEKTLPSSLTLASVMDALDAECPDDGLCMDIAQYIRSRGWQIHPVDKEAQQSRNQLSLSERDVFRFLASDKPHGDRAKSIVRKNHK